MEEVVFKPSIKIKNRESEAPSYEVKFKKFYMDFYDAWNAGVKQVTNVAAKHMESNKKNVKITVGMELTIVKQKLNINDDMMQEWDEI